MPYLSRYSRKTVARIICILREFFRSIYYKGMLTNDLSKAIPSIKFPRTNKIPTVWKKEHINKLLLSVDRGSPLGKRDYAILLLVIKLGLRDGDVRNLKFNNIHWKDNRIIFIQSKTLQASDLPLLPDVGNALIDYLKYGRPNSTSQYMFIKHKAPYDNFKKTGNIITKYMGLAQIPIDRTKAHGVHTLRHTLASNLLEHNVPLEIISGILGHMSTNSAKEYMHLDTENLRKCALQVGEFND